MNTLKTISTMISRNAGLQSFLLAVDHCSSGQLPGNCLECSHPPFLATGSLKCLRRLHLEGRILFSRADWVVWDNCVDWNRLYSLRLVGIALIIDVLDHLLLKLPNLHALALNAHGQRTRMDERLPLLGMHPCLIIINFLRAVSLKELDLTGFTRDLSLEDVVSSSGTRLRRLRLHLNVLGLGSRVVPDVHLGKTAFLGVEKLKYLSITCPFISNLGLDIEESDGTILASHHVSSKPFIRYSLFYPCESWTMAF